MVDSTPNLDPEAVVRRYQLVLGRIADAMGGDSRPIRVVCVTKGFPGQAIDAARRAGATDVGENYAQELIAKRDHLNSLGVHFIGRLQTNKVRSIAALVTLWQSVDRDSIAAEIARCAPRARVLVQVNSSGEQTKAGCDPSGVASLVERCRSLGLDVAGLMTIGRAGAQRDTSAAFAATRALVDRMGLSECSMGMSDDLELALAEGATMVRVGSAVFGPRPVGRATGSSSIS